jgi:hypothetical protein
MQNVDRLSNNLDPAFRSRSEAESGGPSFSLGEEDLFEIRRLCAEGELDEATDRLNAVHVPSEVISPLINMLSEPVATSSFVLVMNRTNVETQYVRGFSVIEGADEMWIMEPYEEQGNSMITFRAASALKVRERFFEMLPWSKDG